MSGHFSYKLEGVIYMKDNKNARIEIRLPESIKHRFNEIALQENTTMSKLIYNFIISKLEEGANSGQSN